MKPPTISVLHPTVRPQLALQIKMQWMRNCAMPENVEYIFSFDENNQDCCELLSNHLHVKSSYSLGCVNKINAAAAVSHGDILVGSSDDVMTSNGWDLDIAMAMGEDRHKPVVMAVDDGVAKSIRPDLLHCFIVSRPWFQKRGYCLHPDFRHVYADDFFTAEAVKEKCIIAAPHIKLEHMHPSLGKSRGDEHYGRCNTPEEYKYGEETFWRLCKQLGIERNINPILT